MNRDEAKLILQSYRPGGLDADDPQFAEALTLAKNDSELAAWLAEQQKFDARVSGGIKKILAPADLKNQILALETKLKTSSPPRSESSLAIWWRNLVSRESPVSWAFEVMVLMVLMLAVFWPKPNGAANFADYSAQMVSVAVNGPHHVDAGAADLKQALNWLAAHRGETNLVLPMAFTGDKNPLGCRVLDWHGQKVSMLCYHLNGSAHVDVFVVEAGLFPDAPPQDQPQFATSDGMPTASWTHGGKVYLAVSHGDKTILKKLLSPAAVASAAFPNSRKFVWNKFPIAVSNL